MSFTPMFSSYALGTWNRTSSMVTHTQLPHVQMDITCDSEVTLEIPYISLTTHLNLLNNEGEWGRLVVAVYLPFQTGTGGSTNAAITLWVSLHDVELVTPAVPFAVAQMAFPDQNHHIRRQGRKPKGQTVGTQEQKAESGGVISSILSSAGNFATSLTQLPLISSYAGTASWAMDILSRGAASVGWSRPINQAVIMRMNRTLNQYQNNVDAVDNAYVIGSMSSNKVSPMPGFGGTDIDEMSLSMVQGVQHYFRQFNWTAAAVRDASLFQLDLVPSSFSVTATSGIFAGPLFLLSRMFNYYRGTFILKLKFAKTNFHSGRLQVVYSPGFQNRQLGFPNPTATYPPGINDRVYLHREIIDVRNGNEFEFTFPFVSLTPYLLTTQSYGQIQIYVLNQLKAPSTCAQNVDCAIEVRGAKDFEFAQLKEPDYVPTTADITLPAAQAQMDMPSKGRQEQGNVVDRVHGVHDRDDCTINLVKPIGDAVDNIAENVRFAEFCIGEKFKSVKQIIQRGVVIDFGTTITDAVRAFTLGALPKPAGNPAAFNPIDYYSIWASCYAYRRGGIIMRAVTTTPNAVVQFQLFPATGLRANNIAIRRNNYFPSIYEKTTDCMASVYVPFYNQTHGMLNAADNVGSGNAGAAYPFFGNNYLVTNDLTSPQGTLITPSRAYIRQAADDTQFAYFLGVPPLQLNPYNAIIP